MRVQTTLAFTPVRRASEGDGAQHSAAIAPAPSLSRKRESDSLLTAPASKRFAVPRRTGHCIEAPDVSETGRTETMERTAKEPLKPLRYLTSFLQCQQIQPRPSCGEKVNDMAVFRDTCCPTKQATDVERRKVHGRLFAFSSAHNGAESLLTGQSSHAVASESVWQSGVRMLSSFGGPNRSHAAPPVMSINPDGTLAVVFQQGGRSMLQTARENLYDRKAVSDLHYITCNNQIQDVSWSARSPNKLVVCSSTTSDVELWNAGEGRREAVLNGQTNFTSGNHGFLAIHAFKDSQHMLAAGGHGPAVQLWDARASTQASMSLPLMRDDTVTSLLCTPCAHRIIAGTTSGILVSWDTRKLAPSNVHVFGSRGPAQAHPYRVQHLPTVAAHWPTVLPYRAQLRFCAGVLASMGEIQRVAPQSALAGAALAAQEANAVRGSALGSTPAASNTTMFRLGLSRSSTLATKALGSKVNHLVEDPSDPRRVAFSLSCGSAGVLHLDNCVVTHVFNPYTYQPRLRPLDIRATRSTPRDIAWSSDGTLLYRVLPQRHLRQLPEQDDVLIPAFAPGSREASNPPARAHTSSSSLNNGGGWEQFSGPYDNLPVRRIVCALDTSSQSALRCFSGDVDVACTPSKANTTAPFCLEYRVQLPSADSEPQDAAYEHEADLEGNSRSIGDQGDSARGAGSQLHARFVKLGMHDSSNGEDRARSEQGGGEGALTAMPGCLESGVAFSIDGAEDGCTLLHDRFQGSLLMCGRTELKRLSA